jgi:succinoglycan biosynthesis transport protein ExoP
METSKFPDAEEPEGALGDYFRILFKYGWLVLFLVVVFVAGAAVYTFGMEPVYEARATLEIQPPRNAISVEELMKLDPFQREYFQTMVQRIMMREVLEPVYEGHRKKGQSFDRFQSELEVEPEKGTDLVQVVLEGTDPERITSVVNEVAKSFLASVASDQAQSSKSTRKVLDVQASDLLQKIEESRNKVDAYLAQHGLLSSLENESQILRTQLEEITKRVEETRIHLAEATANHEEVGRVKAAGGDLSTLPFVAEDQSFRDLEKSLLGIEQDLADMGESLGTVHPDYVALSRKAKEVQRQRDDRIRKLVEQAEHEYAVCQTAFDQLDKSRQDLEGRLREVDRERFEHDRLQRDLERYQSEYDRYLRTSGQLDPMSEIAGSSVKIRELAEKPKKPIRPRKVLNLSLAGLAGLLFGVLLAFLLDYLDDSMKTSEDVHRRTGLPVIGLVPDMGDAREKLGSIDLVSLTNPESSVSEAYRALRTSLTYARAGEPIQAVLLTSAGPGEGKTTSAANLAVTLAHAGYRTLLVDGDMRHPRLHEVFSRENDRGLSSILARGEPLDGPIRETDVPGLFLLTTGPSPPNPSELLGSHAMRSFLAEARQHFDRIVFDSPPTGPVTDACVLAPLMDAVIQIVRAGTTSHRVVRKGRDQLIAVGGSHLGVLLNGSRTSRGKYNGYDYAYYRYGQGSRHEKGRRGGSESRASGQP